MASLAIVREEAIWPVISDFGTASQAFPPGHHPHD